MSEIYNESYYTQYDVGIAKVNYKDSQYTLDFLTQIANRIVDDLHPKTVLDAGCAMGHLVAALRDRGVEAYGIDISEFAISEVREDIRPYCAVGSLTEPLPESLPQHYDLVVTIEVLEHLYAEDGKKAIQNLCSLSDKIIFSSTPDDFTERTHFNVQQREYWARLFAEEGYFDDLAYRPTYLTYYATLFQKNENLLRQIEDYERNIRLSEAEQRVSEARWSKAVEDKERHIQNQNLMLEEASRRSSELESSLTSVSAERDALAARLTDATSERERLTAQLTDAAAEQERLTAQLSGAAAEQERLTAQLTDAAAEQERLTAQLTDATSERERLTARLTDAAAERDHFAELLSQKEQAYDQNSEELARYKEHYHAAIGQREELKRQRSELERQLADAQYAYSVIENAACWKMTKPLRLFLDFLKRIPLFFWIIKGLKCLKDNGWSYTWKKVKDKLSRRQEIKLAAMPLYSQEELDEQRKEKFSRQIKFSIVVPLYNTPEQFLREMIQSVLDQTYTDWELCMADGSDEAHGDVKKICRAYARSDRRIRYQKLEKNLGISGNSNACLEMATGDYIALFDHDDLLHPAALHDVMRAICEQDADFIYTDEATFESPNIQKIITAHFKPDFAIDNLRANNYICHLSVFSKEILKRAGNFRSEYDGSQDHDLILRLTSCALRVVHIPRILYFWRSHPQSVALDIGAKKYAIEAGKMAVRDSVASCGMIAKVESSRAFPTIYRLKYEIEGCPKVSIIIPNKNNVEVLRRCINSILSVTTYSNYEVIIVDNGSHDDKLQEYYQELKKNALISVYSFDTEFNYSKINNFGVRKAEGEYIILLNNDIEVITPAWIEEMLMYVQRDDVAACGAMLYYPNETIQHAGVVLGLGADRVAGHIFYKQPRNSIGYMGRLCYAQDMSAVTAACMMVKAAVYKELGGMCEEYKVSYNDVDFCMRMRKAGYLIVWTPYAELYHYESLTRGLEDTPEKRERFEKEAALFRKHWAKELAAGDPYYNPNLTLDREDFSLKDP